MVKSIIKLQSIARFLAARNARKRREKAAADAAAADYVECWDEASQAYYYYNQNPPYDTTWDKPAGFGAKKKEARAPRRG